MYDGNVYCAIKGQSFISILSTHTYQDFGINYTCRYTTEDNTFDTMNWKVFHRLTLNCSRHMPTGTSLVTVTASANDWAPGADVTVKQINVFSNSPMVYRWGRFRDISLRFEYADNYPFFMTNCELDLNLMGI